jgi:hypothetical protein
MLKEKKASEIEATTNNSVLSISIEYPFNRESLSALSE